MLPEFGFGVLLVSFIVTIYSGVDLPVDHNFIHRVDLPAGQQPLRCGFRL